MSIKLDDLQQILIEAGVKDPALRSEIIKVARETENDNKAEKEDNGPKTKNQFGVVLLDPDGKVKGLELTALVVQIPEDDSLATTLDRIYRASYDFNATKKGQKLPVKTLYEAASHVKRKFFKEANIMVKTKVPVQVVVSDNLIPIK